MNRRKFLGAAIAAPLVPFVASAETAWTGQVHMPEQSSAWIDARGADQEAIFTLEHKFMELAGPGVIERRTVAAVTRAEHRGKRLGPRD